VTQKNKCNGLTLSQASAFSNFHPSFGFISIYFILLSTFSEATTIQTMGNQIIFLGKM
jgi:hypothetical protein